VTELAALNLSAAPLAAGQADLAQQAGAHGYDYVLTAEVTELKVSKPGSGIGGVLKGAATKAAALGTSTPTSDPAEATIAIKLVQRTEEPVLDEREGQDRRRHVRREKRREVARAPPTSTS
jgi:curli biogenesis system outer membrane secretion channel CsgG